MKAGVSAALQVRGEREDGHRPAAVGALRVNAREIGRRVEQEHWMRLNEGVGHAPGLSSFSLRPEYLPIIVSRTHSL